jgi:HD-GYP domain-containing protein (c-di-GMP phosphodiesterase class II)
MSGSGKRRQAPQVLGNLQNPGITESIRRIQGLEYEIASVIQNMQEKVQQLELMNEFAALLNSTLDTDVVREKALEATCKVLRCETASLLLVDEAKAELYWESALGAGKALKNTVRLAIDDRSIAGYVAMTGEGLIVNDVPNDPRHSKKTVFKTGGFVTRNMICVPLKAKTKVLGVLQAINRLPSVGGDANFHEDERRILETLSHQVAIAIDNSRLYASVKKTFLDTVEALAEAIEKKDHYTGGHTKRVVYFSMCIAKYLDLTAEERERIRLGAVLHDVGKIGIEDKILKKQAPLDKDEWKVMQTHPDIGYDIMSRVEGLKDVIAGMRYHHERWDGKGYPFGMKGEEIPLLARIISVADTYDAMVSTRPYRKGIDPKEAFDEIVKYRGTQFDPVVVDAFIEAFQKEKMGKGSGGSSLQLSNCD